jgi:hypothetical protein
LGLVSSGMSLLDALAPPRSVSADRYVVCPAGNTAPTGLPRSVELPTAGTSVVHRHNATTDWSGGGSFGAFVDVLRPALDEILDPTGPDH